MYYSNKCGKLETIEEDILERYKQSKTKVGYDYGSSSEDDKKFYNCDLFMDTFKNKSEFNNRIAVIPFVNNTLDIGFDDIDALPFEANNDVMDISSDENNNSCLKNNNYLNNSFEFKFYSGDNCNTNSNSNNYTINSLKEISAKKDNLFSNLINSSNNIINNKSKSYNKNNNNNNTNISHNNIKHAKDKLTTIQNNQNEIDSISHSQTFDTLDTNKQTKISNTLSHRSNSIKKTKLKEFQFKFTKRENIDKKIMRKFRKYLKEKYRKNIHPELILIINSHKFWIDFITQNLLPPFVYEYEEKEFKSFNTGYMLWIFEHANSFELYNHFINANQQNLIKHFQDQYHLEETDEEFTLLKTYVATLAKIFGNNRSTTSNISENGNYIFDNRITYKQSSGDMDIDDFEENIFSSPPSKNEGEVNNNNNNNNANMNFESNFKQQQHTNTNTTTNNNKQSKRNNYNGFVSLHPTMPDIFNELIQSNNRKTVPFHSKSFGYVDKELNETITDESDEFNENKEEFGSESDF